MPEALSFSAVLLAGGKSARMGTDKALLEVDGLALWRRQWAVLARTGVEEVFLSARPDQSWVPAGVPVVRDLAPDAGPLAGIASAMEKMRGTHLMVLAVDLPRMEPAWWCALMRLCSPGTGAVGRLAGRFEPLAAIYPRELRERAVEAVKRRELSLQKFIAAAGEAMVVHEVTDGEAGWLENWNEPRDVRPGGR